MKKQANPYYMENIQIVLKRHSLLTPSVFQELLALEDWQKISQLLTTHGYQIPNEKNIEKIDEWYREKMLENKHILDNTSIDSALLDSFFLIMNQIGNLSDANFYEFDQTLLEKYIKILESQNQPLLQEYATCRIDFFFLKTLLFYPAKLANYLPYAKGKITPEMLKRWLETPTEKQFQNLSKSPYYYLFEEVDETIDLEKIFEDALTALFRPYRHTVQGVEGILAYIREKNIELYNLRLILKGKIYQLPAPILEERMRENNVPDSLS